MHAWSGVAGTLHDRINRISHYDMNVRDLDRSVAFYESVTTMRADVPARNDQVGAVHGRASGSFVSRMLHNQNATAPSPRLNLVRWTDPPPVGSPHQEVAQLGFYRTVFHVPDLELAFETVVRLGARPFTAITGEDFRFVFGSGGTVAFRVFACHDPDGNVAEFIEHASPKLSVITQGTRTLESDLGFYTAVLGLDLTDTVQTPGPVPNAHSAGGGTVSLSGAFFRVRGDDRGYLSRLQPDGHQHAFGTSHRAYAEPHHVGVVRAVFEVDDLDLAMEALSRATWNGERTRIDHGPLELDFGPLFGARRVVGFRDPEGVGYQLVEQQRYPWARLHPYSGSPAATPDEVGSATSHRP
jgi:catechol 2,3-dioxygenase-like lactoylglutathione lyase family enzyme